MVQGEPMVNNREVFSRIAAVLCAAVCWHAVAGQTVSAVAAEKTLVTSPAQAEKTLVSLAAEVDKVLLPQIEEPWWTIAGNPELGKWNSERQQPVDFAIWQAADGTWQLWSCIRNTNCGGNTRLFYRWEGRKLTDPDWKPVGIAMTADERYGEAPGGLQAPFVLRLDETYWMFYGNWHGICLARSRDGKTFQRVLDDKGSSQLFTEDTPTMRANTRDPMVLPVGDKLYCYYTAYPNQQGAVYCRVGERAGTGDTLAKWGPSRIVAFGGQAGSGPYSAECPFVAARFGWYYLFRTQRYGRNAQSLVYRSGSPLDFGVNDDRYLVGSLPVAAPEIIHHEGQDYIAALLPSLKGIQVARLKWVPQQDNPQAQR